MYTFYLDKNIENKLLSYGFIKEDKKLIFKTTLKENKGFYALFIIQNNTLDIQVFDEDLNEEYLPFKVNNSSSTLACSIKEEVDSYVEKLLTLQRKDDEILKGLLEYAKNHDLKVDMPFDDETSYVIRNQKGKWVALFMYLDVHVLGVLHEEKCYVMNVKSKRMNMIDHEIIFPCFHMNKKYWLSLLLSPRKELSFYIDYIEESLTLVNQK